MIEQNHKKCIGCGNCANVCPTTAIIMKANFEGFLYPVIDKDKCIDCGKCNSVCTIDHSVQQINKTQDSYIAITKDKKLYRNSASGGIFSTAAKTFLEEYPGSIVVGAAFLEGTVKHICIDNVNDLSMLQNSKYVQSELTTVYFEIRKALESNRYVLFSGTPCQIAALKLFLKKDYDKLFTMDIICHGVPSPGLLKKDLESYYNVKSIKNITFRKKNLFFKKKSGFFLSLYVNRLSRLWCSTILGTRDVYLNLFLKGYIFRHSCYSCDFANLNRVGDITIGDCDSSRRYKNFHPKEATSTVIINNDKGKMLWERLVHKIEYFNLDILEEAKINHQLSTPSQMPENRDSLYKELMSEDMSVLHKKYAKKRDIKEFIVKCKFLYLP